MDEPLGSMGLAGALQFMIGELRRKALQDQIAENEARRASSGRSTSEPPLGGFAPAATAAAAVPGGQFMVCGFI